MFTDGEIEFDARGRDVYQKSFVGVVFHVQNDTTWDNSRLSAAVQLRWRRCVPIACASRCKPASYPAFSFGSVCARTPRRPAFESACLLPVPEPNGWVHVRLVVEGKHVRVFINRADKPALDVTMPSIPKPGGVGLWVGDMSNGDFAHFTVTPK